MTEIRTYLGLVDDQVWKHPWQWWPRQRLRKVEVPQALFRCALFPEEVAVINDGYLFINKELRQALLDQHSALRALLELGQVKILSRGDRPDEIPVTRAQRRVTTFQKLIDMPEWKDEKRILKRMRDPWKNWIIDPPRKHLSVAFVKSLLMGFGVNHSLLRNIEQKKEADFAKGLLANATFPRLGFFPSERSFIEFVIVQFMKEVFRNGFERPRTNWETTIKHFSRGDQRLILLGMGAANQAYHIACAVGLKSSVGQARVAVDTLYSTEFSRFFLTSQVRAREDSPSMACIRIPGDINLSDPSTIRELLDVGQSRAKLEVLSKQISQFRVRDRDFDRTDYETMQELASEYSNRLKDVLRKHKAKEARRELKWEDGASVGIDVVTSYGLGTMFS